MSTQLPPACEVAFKEWAGVCRAIADGRQTLILRKGGIREGPGGFEPEHSVFWLFSTHTHEAEQGLKVDSPESSAGCSIVIDTLVVVNSLRFVHQLDALLALDEFHVWTPETVRKRFAYRRPGLWVLDVTAYHRHDPYVIEDDVRYAGCKTWVPLTRLLETTGLSLIQPEPGASAWKDVLENAVERSMP